MFKGVLPLDFKGFVKGFPLDFKRISTISTISTIPITHVIHATQIIDYVVHTLIFMYIISTSILRVLW